MSEISPDETRRKSAWVGARPRAGQAPPASVSSQTSALPTSVLPPSAWRRGQPVRDPGDGRGRQVVALQRVYVAARRAGLPACAVPRAWRRAYPPARRSCQPLAAKVAVSSSAGVVPFSHLPSLDPFSLLTHSPLAPCTSLLPPPLGLPSSPPTPCPLLNTLLCSLPSATMADLCSPDSSGNNVGVAFGLVTASGLATSLGAAAAFWMPLPKPGATSNPWLAASLGAAAGVMVYVSFVEIFVAKSVTAFENCIDRSEVAYLYATLCFFGGVLLTIAFDRALHLFERWAQRRLHAKRAAATAVEGDAEGVPAPAAAAESVVVAAGAGEADVVDVAPASGGVVVATPVIHHQLPMSGVDGVEVDAEAARSRVAQGSHPSDSSNWTDEGEGTRSSAAGEHAGASSVGLVLGLADDDKARQEAMQPMADSTGHGGLLQPSLLESAKAKKDLIRMGMFAGIALAAHNFPEGLATFIAALQDPGVGVSVAVAIGIHKYVRWEGEALSGQLGWNRLGRLRCGVCVEPPPGVWPSAVLTC